MLIGFIGIFIFSLTLPATKLAIPDMNPFFVAYARAALGGFAAIAYIVATKAPMLKSKYVPKLFIIAFCNAFAFPILINIAMTSGSSAHGAIILGLLPLATAILGVVRHHEKPSIGFWLSAITGSSLVIIFSLVTGAGSVSHDDWLIIIACIFASFGYSEGADLAKEMSPQLVISWALVIVLPISLFLSYLTFEEHYWHLPWRPILAILYLGFFSMYIGFFFWYQGLFIGGIARVSQVQLIQPFCTLIVASLFLGDELTSINIIFATLVVLTVMIGKKMLISKPSFE
jgi:drug/metabolite transporter (DMT)-like permease